MTNHQEGYTKMSFSSVIFMEANAEITATLPNFDEYFSTIKTVNGQIQATHVRQEADKSGDTTAKKERRTFLISQAVDYSRRGVAFATNTSNNALLALIDYSESDLKKSSDQKLVCCCQVIHDSLLPVLAAVGPYGITDRGLAGLQTLITNFNSAIPKGRVDTVDSGEATQMLASLFKTLAANWAKIDTLVEMVRISKPSFYNDYVKVRKVIETGSNSLSLKVRATNAQTGGPEANVTLTLTPAQAKGAGANGKNSVVKKTAAGGGSHYKSVADGTYTVTAKKPGFRDAVETISVVNGEMTVLEIRMEKA